MQVYRGTECGEVSVNGDPLDPRLDLRNHSPTGFAWGYSGSGPAQLALAILAHEVGDAATMNRSLYQIFKHEIIANLPPAEPFVLTGDEIRQWYTNTVPAEMRQA